jgi:hypothetical protein
MSERASVGEGRGGGPGEGRTLAFVDHHRQRYADRVTVPCEGEFLIGDYLDGGGVGELGEFKIQLHYLDDRRGALDPQLCVFGDGARAFEALVDLAEGDIGRVLRPVSGREEFSSRLAAFGLRDASDVPPEEGR